MLESPDTPETFSRARNRATASVLALLVGMERWEIALGSDFGAFRRAIADQNQMLGEAATAFFTAVLPHLSKHRQTPPMPLELSKIEGLKGAMSEASIDLTALLWDLRVECQNRMLSALFDRRVAPRQPENPKATVLRRDPDLDFKD